MRKTSGDLYLATISAYEVSDKEIVYYITATDGVNTGYSGSNNSTYIIKPIVDIAKLDCSLKYTSITYSSAGINADKYLTIKDGTKTLVNGTDYKTTYTNNKKIGYQTCTMKITGIGNYTGSITKKLTVKPAQLAAPTLSTKNSSIIVNWKKTTSGGLGYQIIYDKVADFDTSSSNHTKDYHTTTVTDLNTLTKTLSAYTKPGEIWYVRVRTFITSDGTVNGTRYGSFSKATKIVVKGNVGSASIPYSSYTYSGSAIKPTVTIKDTKGNKLTTADYTVTYSNNINVGTATIKITGKGKYQGTLTKTCIVKPAKNSIVSLTSTTAKTFTVKWNKGTAGATGYQIQYAKDKDFTKELHSTSVTNLNTLSKTVSSNVKSGETWYVRVRTYYIPIGSTSRYGNYSAVKTVKIK